MKKIKVREVEYDVIDNWSEMNIDKYIKILELYHDYQDNIDEEFLVKFIELISPLSSEFLMTLYEEELVDFIPLIDNFKVDDIKKDNSKILKINDNIYTYNDINKLTLGEKFSIKILDKESKTKYEEWLNLLSIIIRPAEEKTDEFGEVYYEATPFNADISIIRKRKEYIRNLPVGNALYILENFTTGRG